MSEAISLLVMAAGMGSRYGGLKQLDPVGPSGEVLLDYAVYDAKQAGISRVVFLIRKDLEADFRKVIGKRYEGKVDVAYAFQELHDLPKGFSVPEGRKSRGELGRPFLRQVRSFGGRLWPLMQMIFTAGNRTNFFSNIFPRKRGEAQGNSRWRDFDWIRLCQIMGRSHGVFVSGTRVDTSWA